MKKYKCESCDPACYVDGIETNIVPRLCPFGFEECNWEEVTEEARDHKLQNLTVDVFDRPDCPEWAKYAAVDSNGEACWFKDVPFISNNKTHWVRCVWHRQINGEYDASDWKNSIIYRCPRNKKSIKKEKKTIKKPYKPKILFLVFLFSVIVIIICCFLMQMNCFNQFGI